MRTVHPFPYTSRRAFGLGFGPSVDSLFNDLIRQFDEPALQGELGDDGLSLTVDLPGVAAEDVNVAVADRVLTISVDKLGWKQTLRLRANLDTDSITARHVDGRLTVHVDANPAPEARTIAIDTAPAPEALEVGGDEAVADGGSQADSPEGSTTDQ